MLLLYTKYTELYILKIVNVMVRIRSTKLWSLLSSLKFFVIDFFMQRRDYIFHFEGINSVFYLPYIRTDNIQKTIVRNSNYFEYQELSFFCKQWKGGVIENTIKNSYVIDIGANIGNHTLYFLNECCAKFVYCFEPVNDVYDILEKNILINNLSEYVMLVNSAVGSHCGKGRIVSSISKNTGYTQIEASLEGDIDIIAVDDMVFDDRVGLVKIDVEGFELSVIQGMQDTLKKYNPFVVVEIWHKNKDEIESIMKRLGYEFVIFDSNKDNSNYLFFNEI